VIFFLFSFPEVLVFLSPFAVIYYRYSYSSVFTFSLKQICNIVVIYCYLLLLLLLDIIVKLESFLSETNKHISIKVAFSRSYCCSFFEIQ